MGETKWLPIPLTGPPYKLEDEREQDRMSAQVMDCYIDEAGHTIKRPGLDHFATLGTDQPVDGLYWWDEEETVLAVSGGTLFSLNNNGVETTVGTGLALPGGNRVSFATASLGANVLMAGGQNIVTTDGATASSVADVDAPTTVRSLTVYDQYVIAQVEGSDTFAFDEVGSGGVTWRSQDVLTAESKPDRLMAILGTLDGFELFGRTSTEFWTNDGVTPFSRVRGLTFNRGCGARYSPALLGDTWMWFDDRRVVMKATLNKLEEVSGPIRKELQELSTVEDAIGDIMTPNGWPLYVLTFPTANKTFVYDLTQNHWMEWGNWDTESGTYRRFRGNCYTYATRWGLHLVGDWSNGTVYNLSKDCFEDNDEVLRSLRRTGFITQGTGNKKRCKRIRLKLKRSVATPGVTSPVMQVRWREQGGAWTPTKTTSLGQDGDHFVYVTLTQCGTYRARQYEFIHSDNTAWTLMSAEEQVEILDR
jgi:hypothetical protein